MVRSKINAEIYFKSIPGRNTFRYWERKDVEKRGIELEVNESLNIDSEIYFMVKRATSANKAFGTAWVLSIW